MARLIWVALVVGVAATRSGSADVPAKQATKVIAAFRGQLVVTKEELPEGKDANDTIAKIKKARLTELVGTPMNNEVTAWHFHYAAFLNKTGAKSLKMEFLLGEDLKADKRITDVDPKSSLLTGEIDIDEDENVTKGKTYTVNLVADKHVVSTTKLTMK
jgi:hypothetical protein